MNLTLSSHVRTWILGFVLTLFVVAVVFVDAENCPPCYKDQQFPVSSGTLRSLPQFGLKIIELDYKLSKRSDSYGNFFRYRAKIKDNQDAQMGRWAWDVILGRGQQQ